VTSLSVCCFTAEPLERTAAIFDLFRPVADELVCAVDSRVPTKRLRLLRVDVLERREWRNSIEEHLPWLHSLCSGNWIFRFDNDEVPSQGLLRELPALVESTDLLQYVLPRRWVFPDIGSFINEKPWSDDVHVRLVRNDPRALRFPGGLHTNIEGVEPKRLLDLPFYHLDCVINTREQREAKMARYEQAHPGLETMPGWSVNNHYLPEVFQQAPSAPCDPDDVRLMAGVLAAGRSSSPPPGRSPRWRAWWRA